MYDRLLTNRRLTKQEKRRLSLAFLLLPWIALWLTHTNPGLACLCGLVAVGSTLVVLALLFSPTTMQKKPEQTFSLQTIEAVPPVPQMSQKMPSIMFSTLAQVRKMSNDDFEDFAAAVVMVEHGELEYVRHGGRTNDRGVDAHLRNVYGQPVILQAKRYTRTTVGAPTIRQFGGALHEHGAVYGYVVTSSTFTSGARRVKDHFGARIRLIDGRALEALLQNRSQSIAEVYATIQQKGRQAL